MHWTPCLLEVRGFIIAVFPAIFVVLERDYLRRRKGYRMYIVRYSLRSTRPENTLASVLCDQRGWGGLGSPTDISIRNGG